MGYITSADQRIQNKVKPQEKGAVWGLPESKHGLRCSVSPEIY
jgi:hypothetical protein